MSRLMKSLLLSIAAAGIAAPIHANAENVRAVACSVTVNYLFNGTLRAPYQKDFVVSPGAGFEDDFSTFTRFRFFNAAAEQQPDKSTVVTIGYYNDVGVFDAIDFSTQLTLREDRLDETNAGRHSYFTSQGVAGERTTDYTLTCRRIKS